MSCSFICFLFFGRIKASTSYCIILVMSPLWYRCFRIFFTMLNEFLWILGFIFHSTLYFCFLMHIVSKVQKNQDFWSDRFKECLSFLKMEMCIIWIYVSYRECPLMGLNDYCSTVPKYLLLLCLQFSLPAPFLCMHICMHIRTWTLFITLYSLILIQLWQWKLWQDLL